MPRAMPLTCFFPGNIGNNQTGDLNVGCNNVGTGNRGSCLFGNGQIDSVFEARTLVCAHTL